jgi:hypothetical protein
MCGQFAKIGEVVFPFWQRFLSIGSGDSTSAIRHAVDPDEDALSFDWPTQNPLCIAGALRESICMTQTPILVSNGTQGLTESSGAYGCRAWREIPALCNLALSSK